MTTARILLLPGWQDSGPGHWQSAWARRPGFARVEQADWLWPRRGDWMMQLEEALLASPTPALLAAHSLGCHLVAAWASHSQHTQRVAGALLVAPPDLARDDMPPQVQTWLPLVTQRLPMPSIGVISSDDPYCSAARGREILQAWGCEVQQLTGGGHLNADSGLGPWPAGLDWLQVLAQRAGLQLPV